jgi:hypothetical protein
VLSPHRPGDALGLSFFIKSLAVAETVIGRGRSMWEKGHAFKETGKYVFYKGNNIFFLDLAASKLLSCRKPR